MKHVILVLALLLTATAAGAYPTGAALSYFPVQPCRFLDTRAAHGPLSPLQALNVFVRGSGLQSGAAAQQGSLHADCDVPPSAEVAVVNVTVVGATASGHLVINASGSFPMPRGTPFSRVTFTGGQNTANEIQILLCNASSPGFPHVPCAYDGPRYADFLIWSVAASGSEVHVVGDVIGYYARPAG